MERMVSNQGNAILWHKISAESNEIVRGICISEKRITRSDTMRKSDIERFDNAFPDGVFAFPAPTESPKVKISALDKYCKERGVEPKDLTEEEMKLFLV
jgi:hypothetical protein